MPLTTGTASADWGASAANWSNGLPNSNSKVVIDNFVPSVKLLVNSGRSIDNNTPTAIERF